MVVGMGNPEGNKLHAEMVLYARMLNSMMNFLVLYAAIFLSTSLLRVRTSIYDWSNRAAEAAPYHTLYQLHFHDMVIFSAFPVIIFMRTLTYFTSSKENMSEAGRLQTRNDKIGSTM